MSEPSKAVFLSYASQDAEAARRICEALRNAGIEVWFDQSELRGGDVWDHKIRQQIHDCALFVPVISANTEARTEGYFRLEWKLAVDRSYLMADDAAFLYPVVIDDTPDVGARVPEGFRTVQWTRLRAGQPLAAFAKGVAAILAGTARPETVRPRTTTGQAHRSSQHWTIIAACGAVLIAAFALLYWRMMERAPVAPASNTPSAADSSIPQHSIAVLPFADMSEHHDQEYISDGLAEDLLNLLSKVPGLQVAARTSAFSFKGQGVDVPTICRQLRVANVLEGTVHKVGNHLRVTAQLERAADGYQIWSETYDRELGDVFRIQDEIANAVAKSLKVSLLWAAAPQNIGTGNSDAYLVFLQGRAKMATQRLADTRKAILDFERTLKLDPNYAPAYVELAAAKLRLAEFEPQGNRLAAFGAALEESKLLIERALALDPKDAQAYVERGYLRAFTDSAGAEQDFRRGIEPNPNSARGYGELAALLYDDPDRRDEALAMVMRAHQLDPLERAYDVLAAKFLAFARGRLREADAMLAAVVARNPPYQPAVMLLADLRRFQGMHADAIMYGEQALKLDPLSDWTRRELMQNYIDIGDLNSARQVADEAPDPPPMLRLALFNAAGNWPRAAELAYAAEAEGPVTPASEPYVVFALRMEAHRTHDYRRARAVLEKISEVTWSAAGIPTVPPQLGFGYAVVALGDMLLASGERERGERLLRTSLVAMDYSARNLKRGEVWFVIDRAAALSLLGERKAALAALHKAVDMGYAATWSTIGVDPAFETLHGDSEFQSLVQAIQAKAARERQILAQMRADGRVPDRSGAHPATGRP